MAVVGVWVGHSRHWIARFPNAVFNTIVLPTLTANTVQQSTTVTTRT